LAPSVFLGHLFYNLNNGVGVDGTDATPPAMVSKIQSCAEKKLTVSQWADYW
jgi:hypothetical protein